MASSAQAAPARAVALAALLLAAALAGCAAQANEGAPPVHALADARAMDWSPGNWWAYRATIGNETIDVALIVHEAREDGFHLGSNLSVGFFGLPFSGNVSPELNPRIGHEEWPLFAFPLEHGKEWAYTLFGYEAKSVARAALTDVPGVGARPGFQLEASSFGQVFARYDYVPEVGWFTRLDLIEPSDGSVVLSAELTAYGHDWGSAYYVERALRTVRLDYPELPARVDVHVPSGYLQVRATLSAETASGVLDAELQDTRGRALAKAQVVGKGADLERVAARPEGPLSWALEHRGVGTGTIHLEVTGLSATGPLAAPPAEGPGRVDLLALLQSTRPALPHEGHATSTGLPVAS